MPAHNADNHDEAAALPCSQKLAFDTEREAAAAANVAQYRYGSRLKPYRCQYCGLWHVTTNFDS